MAEPHNQQGDEDALSWLALVVAVVVLGLTVAMLLFFKLNLFEGGTSVPTPTT